MRALALNLRQFVGACRFVYNRALALSQERYEAKEKRLAYAGLCRELTHWRKELDWHGDMPGHALQQSLQDLERAYTNFFKKRADFPKFHKKGQKDSLRFPDAFEVDSINGRVKLPSIVGEAATPLVS